MIYATLNAAMAVAKRLNGNLLSDDRYYAPKRCAGGFCIKLEYVLNPETCESLSVGRI